MGGGLKRWAISLVGRLGRRMRRPNKTYAPNRWIPACLVMPTSLQRYVAVFLGGVLALFTGKDFQRLDEARTRL